VSYGGFVAIIPGIFVDFLHSRRPSPIGLQFLSILPNLEFKENSRIITLAAEHEKSGRRSLSCGVTSRISLYGDRE